MKRPPGILDMAALKCMHSDMINDPERDNWWYFSRCGKSLKYPQEVRNAVGKAHSAGREVTEDVWAKSSDTARIIPSASSLPKPGFADKLRGFALVWISGWLLTIGGVAGSVGGYFAIHDN